MNAAFLLMTSALLVGQGDKKPVAAPPPVTATAPAAASSGCGCDPCGSEGFGHRLRTRMGGLFHRNNCDSCQPTTCQTTHARSHNTCDSCQPKIFTWQPRCHTQNTCAPATCNDSCGNAHVGIFERLRGSFGHNNGCCDTGCSGGCGSVTAPTTTTTPSKTTEPIVTPPKKLPVEKVPEKAPVPAPVNPEKKAGSVSIGAPVTPATPNTISVTPSIPSVELAPNPAPRVEGDRRDPF